MTCEGEAFDRSDEDLYLAAMALGFNTAIVQLGLGVDLPHVEHFICLPTSGTGVSAGCGSVAGLTSPS